MYILFYWVFFITTYENFYLNIENLIIIKVLMMTMPELMYAYKSAYDAAWQKSFQN